MKRTLFVLALLTFHACVCDVQIAPDPEIDAGTVSDAGLADAGPTLDAGVVTDGGGIAQDAGACATSFTGDLIVAVPSDLDPLIGVACLIGSLIIENTALSELDALSSLRLITADLRVDNNNLLLDLDGLATLEDVGGDLAIVDNVLLTSVGLEGLVLVGGDLLLTGLDLVTELGSLEGLIEVGGLLHVGSNLQLSDISGLSTLTSVGGLSVDGNPALQDVVGLENIDSTVTGQVLLANNGDPLDLSALGHLTRVGELSVVFARIDSLDFLANLETVDGLLSLQNLALVEDVSLPSLSQAGGVNLVGNGALTSITSLGSVTGLSGELTIVGSTLLTDASALTPVTDLGSLLIERTGLTDMRDLVGLVSIAGDFQVAENGALLTLDGLENLLTLGGPVFRIANHPALPQATAQALLDRLVADGGYDAAAGDVILVNNNG